MNATMRNRKKTSLAVTLIFILFTISLVLTQATAEDNVQNNTDPLTNVYESYHTENGYKARIILNPDATGIYTNESNYKFDVTLNPNPLGGSFKEGNYRLDLIPEKSFPDQYGISITDVVSSKTIVGQGYAVTINVTVTNQELAPATFSVTIYVDTTSIYIQAITLAGKASAVITFAWVTTAFEKGIYTISAFAIPILGETYTADNTHTDGTVEVTIPCDANGDGIVDIRDLYSLGKAYASIPHADNWNPNCDFNENKNVDNPDLTDLSNYYGTSDS